MIELAVFDLAGTTVAEHQIVYRVLEECVVAAGGHPGQSDIAHWMGASKREAIAGLLTRTGPAGQDLIDATFADFRGRLDAAYATEPPTAFAGVDDLFRRLRGHGIKVALTTGFDRDVTDKLMNSLGWDAGVVDAIVCIDDVPRGRPAPYLVFRAMEATDVLDVRNVLVAGDTVRDVQSGLNAGAGLVVGVTTGDVDAATLTAAGPTHVLSAIAELVGVLAESGQPV